MSQNKIDFSNITQGYKKQFILIKKLLLELQQNIDSKFDLDLLSNIIKMGNVLELAVKGFLLVLGKPVPNKSIHDLIGADVLNGEYFILCSKNLPYASDY